MEDRDYTDSRRIKPNSRTFLLGEQPNPSEPLHPEDKMSRPFVIIKMFISLFPNITIRFRLCLQILKFKYGVYLFILGILYFISSIIRGDIIEFNNKLSVLLINRTEYFSL